MSVTNPETLTKLRDLGCLVNERVDTAAVAQLLAVALEADHIATTIDDIATAETTVGQLASALVGPDPDPDFVDIVRPLLSANAAGKVQLALSDGYLLCGGRTRVDVVVDGQTRHLSIATRFLSADHDVLQQYVLDPRIKRAESIAESNMAIRELVAARQPGMADQLDLFVERLTDTWQKALGTGNPE